MCPKSSVALVSRWSRSRDLGQELINETLLAVTVHGLTDDLASSQECQFGDLSTHIGKRALTLDVDLGHGAFAHALDLGLRFRDALLTLLIRDTLTARHDVTRLASSLGDDALPLVSGRFPISSGSVSVLETLLDALTSVAQHAPDRMSTSR